MNLVTLEFIIIACMLVVCVFAIWKEKATPTEQPKCIKKGKVT